MKFNEALLMINAEMMKQHPLVGFYEAQGHLIPTDSGVDGTIDVDHFKAVYTDMENGTYFGTIKDGKVNIEFIKEAWLEDIIMTPYISMNIEEAIEFATKALGEHAIKPGPVTLRHQLYPGEAEPRYFFGTFNNCNTVNVYTGKVNDPLKTPGKEEEKKKTKYIIKDFNSL
jgi:hypothetical protein